MSVELKVSVDEYKRTLNDYNTQLGKLRDQKRKLDRLLERLSGATFSGSDVNDAINKAKAASAAVAKAIERVEKQKQSIEMVIQGTQREASTLKTNISKIEIPNIFK